MVCNSDSDGDSDYCDGHRVDKHRKSTHKTRIGHPTPHKTTRRPALYRIVDSSFHPQRRRLSAATTTTVKGELHAIDELSGGGSDEKDEANPLRPTSRSRLAQPSQSMSLRGPCPFLPSSCPTTPRNTAATPAARLQRCALFCLAASIYEFKKRMFAIWAKAADTRFFCKGLRRSADILARQRYNKEQTSR